MEITKKRAKEIGERLSMFVDDISDLIIIDGQSVKSVKKAKKTVKKYCKRLMKGDIDGVFNEDVVDYIDED